MITRDEEKRTTASKGIKRKAMEFYGGSVTAARFYKINNGATAAV